MKKHTPITVFVLFVLMMPVLNLHAEYVDFIGLNYCAVSWADIDGDNDLDFIIAGESENSVSARQTHIYKNNGNGEFTLTSNALLGYSYASTDWADYDGDGDLDLLISGKDANNSSSVKIYNNDGNGNFSESGLEFSSAWSAASWCDLNNDGWPDFIVFGYSQVQTNGTNASKIYYNNGDATFYASEQFFTEDFRDAHVSIFDIDNDGDEDVFLMANDRNLVNGDNSNPRFSSLYINRSGTLTKKSIGVPNMKYGAASWADYNGDGFADLLLSGYPNPHSSQAKFTYLYSNNDGDFTSIADNFIDAGGKGDKALQWADYDNDGDFDAFVAGWNDATTTTVMRIYDNVDGASFAESSAWAIADGVSDHSLQLGDADGDGDLDLLYAGWCKQQSKRITRVDFNPITATNDPPSSPTNLSVQLDANDVTFSWDKATDDKTAQNSLSYNLYLMTEDSVFIVFPNANVKDGFRMKPVVGNTYLNTSWTIKNIPNGKYYWSVQAIDAAYVGSSFASAQTFTLGPVASVKKAQNEVITIYPNPARDFISIQSEDVILSVSIYSLNGSLLAKGSEREVDVRGFMSGSYILDVKTSLNSITQKIIIKN